MLSSYHYLHHNNGAFSFHIFEVIWNKFFMAMSIVHRTLLSEQVGVPRSRNELTEIMPFTFLQNFVFIVIDEDKTQRCNPFIFTLPIC